MHDLSTFPWDDLLPYLRDRQLIPIIGSGFSMPGEEGVSLSCYLAKQLAPRLRQEWQPGQDLRFVADGGANLEINSHWGLQWQSIYS